MAITKRKSTNNRYSRFVQGGDSTVYVDRIGWWERREFAKDQSDVPFTITPEYDRRPSKLANDLYGKSQYMFFILQYNGILDIEVEFVAGNVILLPIPERAKYDLFNKQTGGVSPQ